MEPFSLKTEYTVSWLVIGALCLVAQVLNLAWAWPGLFLVGLAVEAGAIKRKKGGDTLSEHLWSFQDGGWARSLLVGAIAIFMAWKFYELNPNEPTQVVLAAGFGAWLVLHLVLRGRIG